MQVQEQTIQETEEPLNEAPILRFLQKKRFLVKQYMKFRIIDIKIHKSYASYQIQVEGNCKKWIMDARYSTLRILYEKINKYHILTFPPKKIIGNLEHNNLKIRAQGLEHYLNEIGRNTLIMKMDEVQAFFDKQIKTSTDVKDYNDFDNFNLDE